MALLKVLILSFATITTSITAQTTHSLNDRLNCALVERDLSETECKSRGCHWSVVNDDGVPWCYLDRQLTGYTNALSTKLTNGQGFESTLTLKTTAHRLTPVFVQLPKLKLTVSPLSKNILRIRLTDPAAKRYEVPVQSSFHFPAENWQYENRAYDVSLSDGDFHLKVTRRGGPREVTLLDTSIGGLVYSDQFIHFATYLASKDVYGFGENYHLSFRRETNYTTLPIFARDHLVGDPDMSYYGHHPVVQIVEHDGKAHGLFLLNSNAMSYTLLPSPALSLKVAGGIVDLFLFVGDSPEHVVQLYTSLVGRPVMPPFWALGYQQCRYGYQTTADVKKVVQRTLKHNIPLDVLSMDIDYMDEYRDFTYSKTHFAELPQYINETKTKHSLRWTLILDPAIQGDKKSYSVFDEGYKRDVFIKWPKELANSSKIIHPKNVPADKSILYGKVWPKGPAAFPDFFKNSTIYWWKDMIKNLHHDLKFDALWIDMNEPSNIFDDAEWYKCPIDKYAISYPQMKFNAPNLGTKTICMNSIQGENGEYRHYDVHSLYGWSETKPTLDGLHEATKKRGFVLSRSTYPSSGRYAAHWLGDNDSSWEQLRQSIIGMLEFSLFGLSFVGADICGFRGNTNAELCKRWFVLGAYSPFSRSHNDIGSIDQDPGVWAERGHPEVTEAARLALRTRYQLLHYLYTRFYLSHTTGETLVRPVHHEFPQDTAARNIDEQFFLGPSIMVNPFLYENQTFHNAYVPGSAEWYRMENNFVSKVHPTSGHVHFSEADSHRPLLLRAATILPVVSEDKLPSVVNTANLRKTPLELWVLPNSTGSASGELFFDDGESIDTAESGDYNFYAFKLNSCHLSIETVHFGLKAKLEHVIKVVSIKVALSSTKAINTESLNVSVDGNSSIHLKAAIEHNTLNIHMIEALDLLKLSKKVVIRFKNQLTGECFTH